jgi:hypothetical protein
MPGLAKQRRPHLQQLRSPPLLFCLATILSFLILVTARSESGTHGYKRKLEGHSDYVASSNIQMLIRGFEIAT